ncbi:MAG TPA: MarR family transcriptional regulator [Chthoniobacterales bacterium]|nr:MarR family transcriptional regulator [Chthoniobacterales bacterium]
MKPNDVDLFGPLLHGTARAWRLKLDERLAPMGLSQAKWRTLMHLSVAPGPLTQTEIAAHLGIEEPTLVTLLHRLEDERWVSRKNASHDRRCKTVHLAPRARRVIEQIDSAAFKLRHELLDDISPSDLRTCIRVLDRIRQKAEKGNGNGKHALVRLRNGKNGHN